MRIGTNGAIAICILCLMVVMVGAIAHQDFSWWVVPFSVLFGTIFVGGLGLCLLHYQEDKFRRAAERDYPDEPWMWDARWRSDSLVSRNRSDFWGSLAFFIVLAMFALFGVASLLKGLPDGNFWVLLNIIPIVAAAYFARSSYIAMRNWRVERLVSLKCEARPAWVGAEFSAVLESEFDRPLSQVNAWMEHIKVVRREEHDETVFENVVDRKLPCRCEFTGGGTVRIVGEIPAGSPATSWTEDEQKRWWELVIVADRSGKRVTLRYEVPVADPAFHQRSAA